MPGEEITPGELPYTSESEQENVPSAAKHDLIRLSVFNSDMPLEVRFHVVPATALGRLKRSYCSVCGFEEKRQRLVYNGRQIADDDTPEKLGIFYDDSLEMHQDPIEMD